MSETELVALIAGMLCSHTPAPHLAVATAIKIVAEAKAQVGGQKM